MKRTTAIVATDGGDRRLVSREEAAEMVKLGGWKYDVPTVTRVEQVPRPKVRFPGAAPAPQRSPEAKPEGE